MRYCPKRFGRIKTTGIKNNPCRAAATTDDCHAIPMVCSSIVSGDAKSFDRVARKWNVDYAFYKTGSDKYLLFFKAGQADAMTACFSEYSRKVLSKAKSNRVPIREQLQQAADQLSKEKPKQKERAKEVAHEDR